MVTVERGGSEGRVALISPVFGFVKVGLSASSSVPSITTAEG